MNLRLGGGALRTPTLFQPDRPEASAFEMLDEAVFYVHVAKAPTRCKSEPRNGPRVAAADSGAPVTQLEGMANHLHVVRIAVEDESMLVGLPV